MSMAPAFGAFERALAWRYVRARRAHGGVTLVASISFVGIMLAVAVLIIVMSVMNGFRTELLSRILGLNGHATVGTVAMGPDGIDRVRQSLARVPGVTHATPVIEGQVLASANGVSTGAYVRAMAPADLEHLSLVASAVTAGGLTAFAAEEPALILGDRLAESLGLMVGDVVTLIAPNGAVTPFGIAPRRKSYRVAGTFNIGMAEYDGAFMFMPLAEGQLFFNSPDRVSQFEVRVSHADAIAEVLPGLRAAAGPDAQISSWQDRNASFFNALKIERNVMRLILMLIVAIAAMNIIAGLVMLVKNKGRDIAILRTMGASRGAILRIFLMIGTGLGVTGAVAGLVVGVVFCANIAALQDLITRVFHVNVFSPDVYFLSHIPARIEWAETLGVVIWAGAMAMLATLPPALRASRIDPVEALRYE